MRLAVFLIFLAQLHPAAAAENTWEVTTTGEELAPLTDDLSRADLFKLFIASAAKENPAPGFARRSLSPKKSFKFPEDAFKDEGKPRANSIFGIDISHYTGRNFSFDSLKEQNVRFVYAKATQGVRYKDDLFGLYWQALNALPAEKKVLRGAYHFLSSSADGAAQADTFLSFLEKNGGLKGADMPPVVDLEWDITQSDRNDRWQSHTPDEIIDITLAWLKRVEEKTGRIPVVYTARTWWRERNIPEESFDKLSHYKIWIADYSRSARATETPPTINHSRWDLWQFSETAELSQGYGGRVDANIYKGTEDQFTADFQIAQN
jgi:lysozyme